MRFDCWWPSRLVSPSCALARLGLLLAVIVGTSATAGIVTDPATGLTFDTEVAGVDTCVVVPSASWDEERCRGIKRAAVERIGRDPGARRLAVLVARGQAEGIVVFVLVRDRKGAHHIREPAIQAQLQGELEELQRGTGGKAEVVADDDGLSYAIENFHGTPGFRYRVRVTDPSTAEVTETVRYVVAPDDAVALFVFNADTPEAINQVGRYARTFMWKVSANTRKAQPEFGQPVEGNHLALGEKAGRILWLLLPLAVLVALMRFVKRGS